MAGLNNRVKITNDIELKDRLVAINRVTKVTKGGRTFSFSANCGSRKRRRHHRLGPW
jgi:rpsE_bact: ribosomal protein S5